jgi:transposase
MDWKIEVEGFAIRTVERRADLWRVQAQAVAMEAVCPGCGQPSRRVHSYYTRVVRDVPVQGRAVQFVLRARRFACRNAACRRRIFAERLGPLVPVYARRTARLSEALRVIGQALGGCAGAHLAEQLHMPVSAATTLRLLRRTRRPPVVAPRVLGVDDWARRRGQVYGTVLVDLERHRPVDLLPDRSAEGVADWLRAHPGTEIVVRDRATEYARGIRAGAPQAQQVVDRWHLHQNLREALQRALGRLRPTLLARGADGGLLLPLPPVAPLNTPLSGPARALRAASQARWQAVYEAVKDLQRQGHGIARIARELGRSRPLVRKYFYAQAFPEWAHHRRHPSLLDPYVAYLQAQLAAGAHNAMQLWRDLQAQGFRGSPKQVKQWVHLRRMQPAPTTVRQYRTASATPAPHAELPSARQLAWLVVRAPTTLHPDEAAWLPVLLQHVPLAQGYTLAQQFGTLLRERERGAREFDTWLAACETAALPELVTFAAGLRADYAAVKAAVTLPWSNGQTEGQVTRLKLVKRHMYGRAQLDLLRLRFLPAS